MRKISKKLPFAETIQIVPFGDLHYGAKACSLSIFKDTLKYIADTPNTYGIGMGDLLDTIIPKDPRYAPGKEYQMVDDAVEDIRQIIEPAKDKILCMLTGNHEYKLYQSGHGDPTKRICRELGVEYGGFSCFLKLSLPRESIHCRSLIIYAHHGWAAGRKSGSVVNNVEGLAQYWEADIYLMGHSHHLNSTKRTRVGWSGAKDLVFGSTGSFLKTAEWDDGTNISYSEKAGYPPLRRGTLKISWSPDSYKHDINIQE